MKKITYSPAIVRFVSSLSSFIFDEEIGGIIRDFENFPQKSTSDLDLIISPNSEQCVKDKVLEYASQNDLLVYLDVARQGPRRVLLVLIVDFLGANNSTDWLFMEIHHGVVAPYFKKPLVYNDFEFQMSDGLPVPSAEWQQIMQFRKLIKKRRLHEASKLVHAIEQNRIAKSLFSMPPADIVKQTSSEKISIVLKDKNALKDSNVLNSLKKFCYLHTPLFKGRTLLYTVQGPDGVGKSTVIEKLNNAFNDLPFICENFHHVNGWKVPASKKIPKNNSLEDELENKGTNSLRFLLKLIFNKLLPQPARQIYLDVTGYDRYVSNINKLLLPGTSGEKIYIVDRFIDDYFVKQFVKQTLFRFSWIEKIYSMVLEKPKVSFLLVDTPEAIRSRKQELELSEIKPFYEFLERSINRRNGNLVKISASNKSPDEIAKEVFSAIFNNLGPNLMPAMKRWKSEPPKN